MIENSNTTLVKVKSSKFYAFLFPSRIQIQHLLKLNFLFLYTHQTLQNSNTTLVKVK